jgi:hypothetical protein
MRNPANLDRFDFKTVRMCHFAARKNLNRTNLKDFPSLAFPRKDFIIHLPFPLLRATIYLLRSDSFCIEETFAVFIRSMDRVNGGLESDSNSDRSFAKAWRPAS